VVKTLLAQCGSNSEVSCRDPGKGLLLAMQREDGVLERLEQQNLSRLRSLVVRKQRNDSQRILGQDQRDSKSDSVINTDSGKMVEYKLI